MTDPPAVDKTARRYTCCEHCGPPGLSCPTHPRSVSTDQALAAVQACPGCQDRQHRISQALDVLTGARGIGIGQRELVALRILTGWKLEDALRGRRS